MNDCFSSSAGTYGYPIEEAAPISYVVHDFALESTQLEWYDRIVQRTDPQSLSGCARSFDWEEGNTVQYIERKQPFPCGEAAVFVAVYYISRGHALQQC
jgi:hypothetical protein